MPTPLTSWPGQRVVVTGAARGIGAAVAERLTALGARLVITDLLDDQLRATVDRLQAQAISADIGTVDGVGEVVDAALSTLGEIDVWVGNAGVARGAGLDTPESDWDVSWQVNVLARYYPFAHYRVRACPHYWFALQPLTPFQSAGD